MVSSYFFILPTHVVREGWRRRVVCNVKKYFSTGRFPYHLLPFRVLGERFIISCRGRVPCPRHIIAVYFLCRVCQFVSGSFSRRIPRPCLFVKIEYALFYVCMYCANLVLCVHVPCANVHPLSPCINT